MNMSKRKDRIRCWFDLRYKCKQPDKVLFERNCYICVVAKKKHLKATKPLMLEDIDKIMEKIQNG